MAVTALSTQSADWPQYRGADHNGTSTEPILKTWPGKLTKIWSAPTPTGFSTITVADGIATTLVRRGEDEVCVALDAATGKELWATRIDVAKYDGGGDEGLDTNRGGDGPRSTPAISDAQVYTLSAHLALTCLDAKTGKQLWNKNLINEFGGKTFQWQSAASPLIDGDLIFVCSSSTQPNSSLMAFNKKDGSLAWKALDEKATHASPIAATILGVRQVIFFVQSGLVSVEAATGKQLWRYRFSFNTSTAASPVVDGDIVYCSAGYGTGSGAARISKEGDGFTATELWRKKGDKDANHWSTPIAKDGYLYGIFDFKKYGEAPMKCMEIATGTVVWSQQGFGPGGAVRIGNNVLALTDDGQLVLVEASTAGFKELGREKVISGKCWNTFGVSNGRAYVRSTKEGACVDLTGK